MENPILTILVVSFFVIVIILLLNALIKRSRCILTQTKLIEEYEKSLSYSKEMIKVYESQEGAITSMIENEKNSMDTYTLFRYVISKFDIPTFANLFFTIAFNIIMNAKDVEVEVLDEKTKRRTKMLSSTVKIGEEDHFDIKKIQVITTNGGAVNILFLNEEGETITVYDVNESDLMKIAIKLVEYNE